MKKLAAIFLLVATPALAQQQVDPAVWPHVVQQIMQQRDQAVMAAATAQVQIDKLTAELEKLKAQAPPDK